MEEGITDLKMELYQQAVSVTRMVVDATNALSDAVTEELDARQLLSREAEEYSGAEAELMNKEMNGGCLNPALGEERFDAQLRTFLHRERAPGGGLSAYWQNVKTAEIAYQAAEVERDMARDNVISTRAIADLISGAGRGIGGCQPTVRSLSSEE